MSVISGRRIALGGFVWALIFAACSESEGGNGALSSDDTAGDIAGADGGTSGAATEDGTSSGLDTPWTPDVPVDPNPNPSPALYPEAILCPAAGDPRCAPPFDPSAALDDATLSAQFNTGLAAWRAQGTRGACVGCHSPDAIELARVGYTDADIRRRALDHVTDEQADAIIGLVHAQRQRHQMTRLLHPARYRPLQPAFEPFHATTPGLPPTDHQAERERDAAFMRHLTDDLNLLWANGTIDSLDKAHQAYEELLALDLPSLRIGVPFDHLSEDGFYGEQHRSVFEWFPGMASRVKPGMEAQYTALVDAYIADPTDQNLWAYYDALLTMTECDPDIGPRAGLEDFPRACEWMRWKWRSLQVLQHTLRHGTTAMPDLLADLRATDPDAKISDHLEKVLPRNPIWEAGDFVRIHPLQRPPQTACNETNHPCTLLPPAVDDTIHSVPTYEEARIRQGEIFQQSWFVMSWLHDPALLYEGELFATFIGDYIESVLLPYYDIHHAFVVTLTAVHKSAARDWMQHPGFREGTGKIASLRTFSFKQIRDNFSHPPDDDIRRATHERMFSNFARMWIFLIEEDLRATQEIYDREDVLRAVRFMRAWVEQLEGAPDPTIDALTLSIESLALTARELRSQANRDATPGTSLQPTDRWAEFSTPFTAP